MLDFKSEHVSMVKSKEDKDNKYICSALESASETSNGHEQHVLAG